MIFPSTWSNSSFWPINGILTGTITPGQSGTESNGNKGVLYISQTPRLEPHQQMQFNVTVRILNGFKFCYLTLIFPFKIIHSFAHS